ncbi:MAG: TolC family protein [Pseudomonadota bacterium]
MLSLRWLWLAMVMSVTGCAVPLKPFTGPELNQFAADKAARVRHEQVAVNGPIDLYEAMARALKFNLDLKVELMEEALRARELDFSKYDMLPDLVANAGYSKRSNDSGASSQSLISGRESLEPSTSSERESVTADLELSWDVLDFGLSYVRAKQSADEVMIALERRRKVANRIIEDVRTAYWRAVSSQRLVTQLEQLEVQVESAFNNSTQLVERRKTSPLTALTYQRELMDIKRELQGLHRELAVAKFQLAALMNLGPNDEFTLVIPERNESRLELRIDSARLVGQALRNRPEIREVAYQLRINESEAERALLELLPNFKGFLGWNFDGNDFLYKSNWVTWGARASWNAMRAFSYPARKDVIEAQGTLLDQRALALTMAIMTQVHVGRARYEHLRREFKTARRARGIQHTIIEQIQAQYQAGKVSRQTLIREQMNALVAEFRRDVAFADLQNAFANVYASIGLDPYEGTLDTSAPLATITQNLAELWKDRGDLSQVAAGASPTPEPPASENPPPAQPTEGQNEQGQALRWETIPAPADAPVIAVNPDRNHARKRSWTDRRRAQPVPEPAAGLADRRSRGELAITAAERPKTTRRQPVPHSNHQTVQMAPPPMAREVRDHRRRAQPVAVRQPPRPVAESRPIYSQSPAPATVVVLIPSASGAASAQPIVVQSPHGRTGTPPVIVQYGAARSGAVPRPQRPSPTAGATSSIPAVIAPALAIAPESATPSVTPWAQTVQPSRHPSAGQPANVAQAPSGGVTFEVLPPHATGRANTQPALMPLPAPRAEALVERTLPPALPPTRLAPKGFGTIGVETPPTRLGGSDRVAGN